MNSVCFFLKRVVTDEYFLGYYDANKQDSDYFKQSEDKLVPNVTGNFFLLMGSSSYGGLSFLYLKIQWRNFEGQNTPMFAVKYTDGTPCDVIGNVPRETNVFYGRSRVSFNLELYHNFRLKF